MQNSNTNDREVFQKLDEVAKKYANNKLPDGINGHFKILIALAVKYGAEWQSQNQALPLTDDELRKIADAKAIEATDGYCKDDNHSHDCCCGAYAEAYIAGYRANRGSGFTESVGRYDFKEILGLVEKSLLEEYPQDEINDFLPKSKFVVENNTVTVIYDNGKVDTWDIVSKIALKQNT